MNVLRLPFEPHREVFLRANQRLRAHVNKDNIELTYARKRLMDENRSSGDNRLYMDKNSRVGRSVAALDGVYL